MIALGSSHRSTIDLLKKQQNTQTNHFSLYLDVLSAFSVLGTVKKERVNSRCT